MATDRMMTVKAGPGRPEEARGPMATGRMTMAKARPDRPEEARGPVAVADPVVVVDPVAVVDPVVVADQVVVVAAGNGFSNSCVDRKDGCPVKLGPVLS